jgi:agmatinase
MPTNLSGLSWESPHNFLGIDPEHAGWDRSRVAILPVPYEATVSYQSGTKRGPAAILEASRYVETYDQELDREPFEIGIHTFPALHLSGAGPEQAIRELREACDHILAEAGDRLLVTLGGEHSISSAPILAHAARLGDGRISVLQLDAHSDLRLEYEGSPYSHAAVMARCLDRVDITAVGIRAVSREERELMRRSPSVTTIFAEEMWRSDEWIDRALASLGETVYITFDVDYFDPAIIPATGTPEPGGGAWYPTLALLRRVFNERRVVGVDVVELAPIAGNAAPDFAVAKLIYKMIGYHAEALSRR